MDADRERAEALRWLLEPPASREVHLYVDVGRETELTPEVREALNALVRALEGEDVAGFRLGAGCTGFYSGPCWSYQICPDFTKDPCASKQCQPLACRICTDLVGIQRT
jgi:hypothetical protein